MKKLICIAVACLMLLSLAACGKSGTDAAVPTGSPLATDAPVTTEQPEGPAEYTYRIAKKESKFKWNPHTWFAEDEAKYLDYIVPPLVDITIADDGVNFAWVYEMAVSLEDVTATYKDREKWLEPNEDGSLPEEKLIYRICLNPDAAWSDGTPINAGTYIYSMQQILNRQMTNNALPYINASTAIKNAAVYLEYSPDKLGKPVYSDASKAEEGPYYINFNAKCSFCNNNSAAFYYDNGYGPLFMADDGSDLFLKYCDPSAQQDEYIEVTDEIRADLMKIASNFGAEEEEAWKGLCFVVTGVWEEASWEDVGLIAEDDYTLIYVLETPVSEFGMRSLLTANWIVFEPLYESCKTLLDNDEIISDYGTSVETTASCGPYKLVSMDNERYVLERNENWYGWNDGKHEGQFMTTRIVINVVQNINDLLDVFLRGELDEVALDPEDLETYGSSANLLKTDEIFTGRFVFATDLDKLTALENNAGDGSNKRVLCYKQFRKAISLSIDRAGFCAECTSCFKPAYFLLNDLYYCDIENDTDSQYRGTKEGRDAILRLYGIECGPGTEFADDAEAYASVTGYDVEAARALFREAYEQAVADGLYTDGQPIVIRCSVIVGSPNAEDIRQQDYLNRCVAAAAEGTGFEGMISFEFTGGSQNRTGDVARGKIEMIRTARGGNAFDPFSSISSYCDPDVMDGILGITESCGWDPTAETLTIVIDGAEVTDTIQNWAKAIISGGRYSSDEYARTRLLILSELETAVLGSYQCIPYGTYTACSLFSKKIEFAEADYNIMYGYGGVRLMKYNYSDAEWDAFIASQGGTIDYR